jgi:uncharacterized protein YlxW (UPF0749 family)
MGSGGVARRRWFGGAVLGAALLMLILGQTVLQRSLQGLGFLVFWLLCLALTAVAVLVAVIDARASRTELKREKRELLEQTVREIQEEAVERNRRRRNGSHKPRPTNFTER